MANLNKVMLIGNLTRDPESKFLPSGTAVCELGMAINRIRNDPQTGEKREQVCYVDLTAFGRQAETLGRYMKRGKPLFVEGRLDFQSWETQDGQKRNKLKVVIENFQFLGGREEGGGAQAGGQASGQVGYNRPQENAPAAAAGGGYAPAPSFERPAAPQMDEDDIPF
ncbi:MAG: single-stranded DNA-binding protein [Planctomycetota bacterium]